MVILFNVMAVSVFLAQGASCVDPQHKLLIESHGRAMQDVF